jgi:hypothetical protein
MSQARILDDEVTDALWLVFRGAVAAFVKSNSPRFDENENEYRVRAEKAGVIAVASFVGKAYQKAGG